jgi:hypothetical protein
MYSFQSWNATPFSLFSIVISHYMFRLYVAIFRCGSVNYFIAIVLKIKIKILRVIKM